MNTSVRFQQAYDYATLLADIDTLQKRYPFIRTNSIGKSVAGKEIPEISIGCGPRYVHFNGSFHAREWITTSVLMFFLEQYAQAVSTNRPLRQANMNDIYEQTTLSIVPMVNPDGVDLVIHGAPEASRFRENVLHLNDRNEDFSQWKANIRGVDLNNQFPAKWEIEANRKPTSPAPANYPGAAPLTEPEAIAIAKLTEDKNFDRVLALHTQGKEIYWGFVGLEPDESNHLARTFAEKSGYEAIRYVDSYAGYKDWFIQKWQRPGFTIELGEGSHPLPLTQFPEIYDDTVGILLASLTYLSLSG